MPLPLPRVSIVILTALGATHLPACLDSLREQSYPSDLREVIVVDNASAEDPTAVVERHYPGARVLRNATNVGFSAGNNVGARAATGEYVVFLNDDTRAHPDWLRELVGTAQRRGAACAASRILDWDGARIDFVGGAVNLEGKGFQIDHGQPDGRSHLDEKPLLFACGGAMLVDREILLDSDGWDEDAFAYYEDLELGWRLWLLGHEIWFAPAAIIYHKHHGTWGGWPEPPRLRLYERNSFRVIYTHLERRTQQYALAAGLLLAADRILLATSLSRASSLTPGAFLRPWRRLRHAAAAVKQRLKVAVVARGASRQYSLTENLRNVGARGLVAVTGEVLRSTFGMQRRLSRGRTHYLIERGSVDPGFDALMEPLPVRAAAALAGLQEFLLAIPALSRRRAEIQARRRRSDRELLNRFGSHWFNPCPAVHQAEHNTLHDRLVDTIVRELSHGREA